MNARYEKALNVLKNGGYFRRQLESQYRGGEKFVARLRDKSGAVVKGVGEKTYYEFVNAGLLQWRDCPKSSVWPEEYVLKQ